MWNSRIDPFNNFNFTNAFLKSLIIMVKPVYLVEFNDNDTNFLLLALLKLI